jgi:hypothetical protein
MKETWEKIKGFAHKHPILLGIILFIIGFVIILWWRSGSSSGAQPVDNSSLYGAAAQVGTANDQLQAAAIGAQAATNQTNAQAATEQASIATQGNAYQIAGDVQKAYYQSQEDIALAGYQAQIAEAEQAAAVQEASFAAQVKEAGITTTGNVEIAGITTAGNEAIAKINADAAVSTASINAQAAEHISDNQTAQSSDQLQGIETIVGSVERQSAAQNSLAFWRPGTNSTLSISSPYISVSQQVATPNTASPYNPNG